MSARTSLLIKAEHIQKILEKWTLEEKKLKDELKKPVIIFVGGVGTGKSSCIKVLLNITDENELKKLNIIDRGKCGTTVARYKYQSNYLFAIDIRGKLENQNLQEYAEYVRDILYDEKRIDVIIGVVEAYGVRNGDIDTLIESLEIIYREWEKPFVVIMNKIDQVKALNGEKQFEIRKKYVEEQCEKLREKLKWKFENHPCYPHGVFPVSAIPMQKLEPECPNPKCVKPTEEVDEFADPPTKYLVPGDALQCNSCNTISILKPKLDSVKLERIKEHAQAKGLSIIEHKIPPIGLEPRTDLMQAIIFLTHEIILFALMKGISKTLSDSIVATTKYIHEVVQEIYGMSDAIHVDKLLCTNITRVFGLEQTAFEHSEYEVNRWEEVGRLKRFERFLRRFTNSRHQGLADYMTAWGIYYARKYHDIAVTISDGFKAARSHEDIAKQCNEICAQYTEIRQLDYYQCILEDGREAAIEKYVLKYEKVETSNNVVENEPGRSTRVHFGKT